MDPNLELFRETCKELIKEAEEELQALKTTLAVCEKRMAQLEDLYIEEMGKPRKNQSLANYVQEILPVLFEEEEIFQPSDLKRALHKFNKVGIKISYARTLLSKAYQAGNLHKPESGQGYYLPSTKKDETPIKTDKPLSADDDLPF